MENQNKITKENAIAQVQSSVSSIFSKDDVLFLLNAIEEINVTKNPTVSEDVIKTITLSIMDAIKSEADRDNIVCMEDVEFELNWHKTIEVTDVPINFDAIEECIENELLNAFDQDEDENENKEVIEAIANNEL